MDIVVGIIFGGFVDNVVIKRNYVIIDDLKLVRKIGLIYYKVLIIYVSMFELKFIRLEDFSVRDYIYIFDIFLLIVWFLKILIFGWFGV